ncbi:MAG: hypothetical protein ACRDTD_30320 [Pseudonocardiaceae bacterium]
MSRKVVEPEERRRVDHDLNGRCPPRAGSGDAGRALFQTAQA